MTDFFILMIYFVQTLRVQNVIELQISLQLLQVDFRASQNHTLSMNWSTPLP
jgi:hypothetical protein